MAKRRPQRLRKLDKLVTLEEGARAARYAYFVRRADDEDAWMWGLFDGDNLLCSSPSFRSRADCVKSLPVAHDAIEKADHITAHHLAQKNIWERIDITRATLRPPRSANYKSSS
jgi:hypothetical protein